MNPLQVGALVGVLTALSAWCVAFAVRRAPRSLAIARYQMRSHDQPKPFASHVAFGAGARWLSHRFGSGLMIVQMTPADVVGKVFVTVGISLFATLSGFAALAAVGTLPMSPLWLIVAIAVAFAAGWIVVRDIDSKITRRRRELRQAANDFVQLVAVGLTTDQSVEEAINFASSVGDGAGFETLRQRIQSAPQRGVPIWEALDEFGQVYDIREISELATSVERQGMQGVSIGETVATLAAAMRAKALDDLEREADRANANLTGPTVGFVVTTIAFLAYPLAYRISEAFGG